MRGKYPIWIFEKFSNFSSVQYKTRTSILTPFRREADEHLSALIIYEDVASGERAKEACEALPRRLGPNWKLKIELFSFKALRASQLQREAATAASKANLVIFSCRHADLPLGVWEWIELFLRRPAQPTALVALLPSTTNQARPRPWVAKYLAGVAQRRGMQYFSHIYQPAAENVVIRPVTDDQKEPNDDAEREMENRDYDYRSGGIQRR